jgi:hypothetical protein
MKEEYCRDCKFYYHIWFCMKHRKYINEIKEECIREVKK